MGKEMKQEMIIEFMKDCPEKLQGFFEKIQSLYFAEFGGQWLAKELKEATETIKSESCFNVLAANPDQEEVSIELDEWLDYLPIAIKKMTPVQLFIGIRSVSHEQFLNYSKGLYFMAAYLLIKK